MEIIAPWTLNILSLSLSLSPALSLSLPLSIYDIFNKDLSECPGHQISIIGILRIYTSAQSEMINCVNKNPVTGKEQLHSGELGGWRGPDSPAPWQGRGCSNR